MIDQHTEIVFNRRITSGIFLLGFKSPRIASESRPGQFVMVRINKGIDPLLRRPFSIFDVHDKNTICILYKTIGHGTYLLSGKKAGERISVMGPLGRGFSLPDEDRKALLVSGGIGAAPLYFLAGALKNKPMEFMSGFATSMDIIPLDQETGHTVGISIATDDGSKGYSGMVTGLLDEYLTRNIHGKYPITIYACGPLAMLKKVSSIAFHHNIPCQVSLEALMACGLGACQGCVIPLYKDQKRQETHYKRVCKEGPVFDSWEVVHHG